MTSQIVENLDLVAELSEEETLNSTQQSKEPLANKEQFNSILEEKNTAPSFGKFLTVESSKSTLSLMDAVRNQNYRAGNSSPLVGHDKLIAQTREAIAKIEEVKQTLETPDVRIKTSSHGLLHNNLTHINENLKAALIRAEIELDPTSNKHLCETTTSGLKQSVKHFANLLTQSQGQLETLGEELTAMSRSGIELSPVNMLAIQVKLGSIQQQLELFANMLNKSLEMIKTVMNVQN